MGHSYCNLLYHMVFSTKERVPLLQDPVRERVQSYLGGAVNSEGGIVIAVGGTEDHVHLFARLHQMHAPANVLRSIKANSSKWVHEEVGMPEFAWQEGYGAFTVSQSQAQRVHRYVRGQAEHHVKLSFKEEFLGLLRAHEIEYDEKYIWD